MARSANAVLYIYIYSSCAHASAPSAMGRQCAHKRPVGAKSEEGGNSDGVRDTITKRRLHEATDHVRRAQHNPRKNLARPQLGFLAPFAGGMHMQRNEAHLKQATRNASIEQQQCAAYHGLAYHGKTALDGSIL